MKDIAKGKKSFSPAASSIIIEHINSAFVREIDATGNLKLYHFYEESDAMLGGPTAAFNSPKYGTLNVRYLLRKGNGPFLKLDDKKKNARKEMIAFLGDCEKTKKALERVEVDVQDPAVVVAIVRAYNDCKK